MRASVNGLAVGYEEQGGGGTPLLLLHAFPFDRHMWDETAAALVAEAPGVLRIVAMDARGFGESDAGPGGHGIAALADDAAGLLDALGIERAAVAGLSMGGYTALAFAARHAHRLAGLVLSDTRAGADSPETRRARDEAIALVRREGAGPYLDRSLPRLLAPTADAALRARVRALAEPPAADVAGAPAGAWAGALAGALAALRDRPDRSALLPRIACPTLVVVGAEDAVTPPAEAHALAAAIPGARLVEIEGAGHLANLERPRAFVSAVAPFLRALAA